MNGTAEVWPYSELAKFEVVALGCHRKLHAELTDVFRYDYGIEAFQLVEYFLREPIARGGDSSGNMVCFPFLRRLLEHNTFQLRGQDGPLEIQPLTSDLRENVEFAQYEGRYCPKRYALPFEKAIIGQTVFDKWSRTLDLEDMSTRDWFHRYSVQQWEEHERLVRQAPQDVRDIYLVEFNLVGRFWKACANGIATIVGGYPICSASTFYGYFVLVWPEPPSQPCNNTERKWRKVNSGDIIECLKTHAGKYYVPTLTLLHNSIWEDRLSKRIDKISEAGIFADEIDVSPISRWSMNAEDELERGLARLWDARKQLFLQPNGVAAVKETLLFKKYNIASPGMVNEIRKIIQRAPHFCQPEQGAKLPAALVYGEAGAGKDTMAKLIQLFTLASWKQESKEGINEDQPLGYFGLKPNAINMSALKPNALFGPLFQGMNVSDPRLNIPSILLLDDNPDSNESGNNNIGVFIFDELNSLDADLQGVLLRILENGEVTPLFDIRPSYVGHLIIGVVNEDPEILMRENETRNLKQMKAFTGEFIGNALYEFFVKGRRLRPDLFYRLSRGLYIKLPSLRERRDDIPILFYFECEAAVRQELKNVAIDDSIDQLEPWASTVPGEKEEPFVYVELKAYESLMLSSLDWPGNVRQLQAVATEIAVASVKEYADRGQREKPGVVCVRNSTVLNVLSSYFPSVFEEHTSRHNERR